MDDVSLLLCFPGNLQFLIARKGSENQVLGRLHVFILVICISKVDIGYSDYIPSRHILIYYILLYSVCHEVTRNYQTKQDKIFIGLISGILKL